jgi:membrane fusion protein (multidrug efflux system)
MSTRYKWLLIGVALLVAGGGTAAVALKSGKFAQPAKKEVPPLEFTARDVVQVTPRKLAVRLSFPGNVQAVSQATVRSKLSAEVRRVLVREGDRVSAGQVVAEFDTSQLRAQLAERVATLESARAQLAQSERTREANAQLIKQNFISQNAMDTADAALRAQAAAVEAARAQLVQMQLQLADAVVRAPIAGEVAKRNVQPGEKVAFDAPLLTLVDLADLEVQAQAPVSDVAQVARSAPVEIEIEGLAGRSFAGQIDRINPAAEPGSRTIHLYVRLPNERAERGWLLRAGMFARVRMQVGTEREVPALPLSAIRTDGGQPSVWIIADGKLMQRAVELGRRDERAQFVEIVGGLAPTDRVLATRFDNLRDGLAARVVSGAAEAKVADKDAPRAPASN